MKGECKAPLPAALPILAQAYQRLWPVLTDDVYREFTYISHAGHSCPLPPRRWQLPTTSRIAGPVSGQDTFSESSGRFVTLPPYLLEYG